MRPHVSSYPTHSTIHQTSLYPQVLGQEHSRTLAQLQFVLHTAEIVRIHLRRSHALTFLCLWFIVVRTTNEDRLLRILR